MKEHKPIDLVKEIAWNLLIYVLYYIWSFIVLLIFHFLTYRNLLRLLQVQWTVKTIAVYALVMSTVMMIVRVAGLIRKSR